MEDMLALLIEIRDQLIALNEKFDSLTLSGTYNIADITQEISNGADKITGPIGYNLDDIFNQVSSMDTKLSSMDSELSSIDSHLFTISLKD